MEQLALFPDPAIASALAKYRMELTEKAAPLVNHYKSGEMQLRPYQNDCVRGVLAEWETHKNVLAVLPTGAGKTIVFSKITQACLPGRTLILAHREELISQAAKKLKVVTGIDAAIEKADRRANVRDQVVVGSIQTLQGSRLASWPQNHFARIVVDEAHHALSSSYQNILNWFCTAKVLGVTATPFRGDKKDLGAVFETIAYEVGLIKLIKEGYLAAIRIKSIPLKIDLNSVKSFGGDYDANDLDEAITPILEAAAQAIAQEASGRKTLVFMPLIKTSIAFCKILQSLGISAAHVSGESEDREEILADYSKGKYQVLCNAMLLTEGYDEPSVDCIVIMRPTKSQPLYAQMVGRGTRICEGKKDCLILDFLWLHEKLSLIRPAHLIAETKEEAEYITKELAKAGSEEVDLLEVQDKAENAREESLRKVVEANAKKKSKTISIEELAVFLHTPDIANFEPSIASDNAPPTEKQCEMLLKWKLDPTAIKTKLQATEIIDKMVRRMDQKLSTPNQIKYLMRYGVKDGDKWSFDRAGKFLSAKFR